MLEDPTSQPLKSSLTLKGMSFPHNKQVADRLHPSCEVFAYLVLRGKVCLNPQFANPLSSSRMGDLKHYHSMKNTCVDMTLTLPQYEEYLCRYDFNTTTV
jgi:hypothetical protein